MRGSCRWVSLCVLVGALCLAVPAVAASPPPRATCGKLLPPASGAYLGAFTDFNTATRFDEDDVTSAKIDAFERLADQKLAWVYFADHWWKGLQFPAARVLTIWRQGAIPYIAFQPHSGQLYGPGPAQQFPEPRFTLQRIIDGRFDAGLRRWADGARDWNIPVLVEFGTEVNDSWGPWNGRYNGGSDTAGYGDPGYPDGAERFRDAFRHVVRLFREEGATNVTWFFHADSYRQHESWNQLKWYYPGDGYVDWVGISDYGALSPAAPIVPFTEKLDWSGVYRDLSRLSRRPLAIVEMGVVGRADRTAGWIRAAFAALRNHRYPRIKAASWWNTNSPPTDSRVDSAPEVLAAFREAVAGMHFAAKLRFTGNCLPAAPTGVRLAGRRLTWARVRNAAHYDVFRDGVVIGATEAPRYADRSGKPGLYSVRAVNLVGQSAAAVAAGATSLRITVWPQGRGKGPHRTWTLRCKPAGGTLPRAAQACTKLLALRHPFAPTPRGVACTQIYGGPQEALVTGTLAGRAVNATFNRRDGCQIDRWNRIRFLFGADTQSRLEAVPGVEALL